MQMQTVFNQLIMQSKTNRLSAILGYGVGILFLSAMAQLSIPLQPVPMTFESSSVILLGFLLGSRRASSLVSVYLLLGFLGLPLFAGWTGGLGLLLTPKAGYFVGFIPAAYLAGLAKDCGFIQSFWRRFCIALFASAIIFSLGVAWFSVIANFKMAWQLGVMPFIVTEILKIIGVSLVSAWITKKN